MLTKPSTEKYLLRVAVKADVRKAIGKAAGDTVLVRLEQRVD